MLKKLSILTAALMTYGAAFAAQHPEDIWSIGKKDGTGAGLALAPDNFRDFIKADFGYEDKYYLIGHSSPEADFPYALPGPADTWGGTWPTSGWRTHQVNILFGFEEEPCRGRLQPYNRPCGLFQKVSPSREGERELTGHQDTARGGRT